MAGCLWGMMRVVGGVRKSIHQSWLAKRLGLVCWGFKGVQGEIAFFISIIRHPHPNDPVGIDLTPTPIPAANLRIHTRKKMTTEKALYIILQQPKIGRSLYSCFSAAMTSLFGYLFTQYVFLPFSFFSPFFFFNLQKKTNKIKNHCT